MIRLLNLGPAKHEKVAIYVVNQRIRMFARVRELLRSGAIRRHQPRSKGILTPMIHGLLHICKSINHIYYALS